MSRPVPRPIALPGIHEQFLPFLLDLVGPRDRGSVRVLDAGAGEGALSRTLLDAGFSVAACDLLPERFACADVEFRRADVTDRLPYDDASFDFVAAVELLEHVHDHERFFRECRRVLRPGGMLVASTPNILSLKSRVRFLCSGFFYSFKPLDLDRSDGLQHVSSLTLDQYRYVAGRTGFALGTPAVDRYQRSSFLLLWLVPLFYVHSLFTRLPFRAHNTMKLLLGRVLFLTFRVRAGASGA